MTWIRLNVVCHSLCPLNTRRHLFLLPPHTLFELSTPPPSTHMHAHAHAHTQTLKYIHLSILEKSALCIYTDSLQRAHVQLIFSILQQHDILTGERVSRRIEGEKMERDMQRVVFPHLTIMSGMSNEGERQRP